MVRRNQECVKPESGAKHHKQAQAKAGLTGMTDTEGQQNACGRSSTLSRSAGMAGGTAGLRPGGSHSASPTPPFK